MPVDQRIRERLQQGNTHLPEPDTIAALDRVTSRARTSIRRRRLIAVGAAAAVMIAVAGVANLAPEQGGPRPAPRPAEQTPRLDEAAAQVIATGDLRAYGADATGSVLTVWSPCDRPRAGCESAWMLGEGGQPLASGMLGPYQGSPQVVPAQAGFLLQPDSGSYWTFVTRDGATRQITSYCPRLTWPARTEPGRYVLGEADFGPMLVDTVAHTFCDTSAFEDARTLSEAAVADDGTIWGLTGDGIVGDTPGFPAVARYDGTEWVYRDLVAAGLGYGPWDSSLAVARSHVAVLVGDEGSITRALTVTTDGGATWSDVDGEDLPFRRHESVAFSGTSALLVADSQGALWRSTDWARFSRVPTPGRVSGLERAGNAAIARIGGEEADALVVIGGDGSIEPLDLR